MPQKYDLCFSTQSRASLPIDANDLEQVKAFRTNNPHILGNFLPAGTPFVLPTDKTQAVQQSRPDLACALSEVYNWPSQSQRKVAQMNNFFGDEQLQAIAAVYEKEIKPYVATAREMTEGNVDSLTGLGAGATAIAAKEGRLSSFGKAIFKYQTALIDIHHASKNKANKTTLIKLGQIAKAAHLDLNEKFAREVKHFSGVVKANKRGNIWSSAERGSNIARSSRNTSRLRLTSLSGIRSIRGLEMASDIAGKGIIALDAGIRADSVYNDYKAGKDWQRSAVVETTGFGAGTAAGLYVGAKTVALGTGIALALGPVGWVILIGVGIGAGYAAGKTGDYVGQWFSGQVYDFSSTVNW
ncbi:hypothetical protein [Shewanella japonica]|uniref:hypothetical protein n=1 Tax=Shewanella japonica TaxID=93973 RepID=UPI002493E825|nr:hypothetical protein [Shewanella japonica]